MVYVIFLCFAAPLALMLPLLRGQSRRLVAFMLLGAAIAVSAAEINTALQELLHLSSPELSLRVTPVTEELLKAIPVLLYAVFGSDDRKKLLPLAMAVGIGFAISENAWHLLGSGTGISLGLALLRGVSTSLMHSMCTFLVGCGMIFVKKQKKLFYTGTFGLLTVAVTFHATFNLLLVSPWYLAGLLLPIVVYLVAQAILARQKLRRFSPPQ